MTFLLENKLLICFNIDINFFGFSDFKLHKNINYYLCVALYKWYI